MEEKQRILIISYFFYPYADVGAKRVSELARFLRNNGHDVTVITSNRQEGRIHPQLVDAIEHLRVIKTWDPPSLVDSVWKKLKHFLHRKEKQAASIAKSATKFAEQDHGQKNEKIFFLKRYFFSYQALWGGKKIWALSSALKALACSSNQKFDVVISSSPYTVAHAAAWALKFFYKTPWLVDLRDPLSQPETIQFKSASTLRTLLENGFDQAVIKYSDKIICASPGIERHLVSNKEAKDKLCTILNGYDGKLLEAPDRGGESNLKLLYAGQLYFNRNPFPLIYAIKNLIQRGDVDAKHIALVFYGQCEKWQGINLRDVINKEGLQGVVFINGHISSNELAVEIKKADVLINFAQGQKNQIPAKSYEYMQSGKYSLVFTEPDSDTAMLVQASATGIIVNESNLPEIENAVKDAYDKKMRNEDLLVFSPQKIKKFARENQNQRYYDLIMEVMGHG